MRPLGHNTEFFCRLQCFDLTFEETIYAIVFDLAEDLARRGKAAVFRELSHRNRMSEYIQNISDEARDASRHLGVLQEAYNYKHMLAIRTRQDEIEQAVEYFRKGYDIRCDAPFWQYLLGNGHAGRDQAATGSASLDTPHDKNDAISVKRLEANVDVLFTRIQKLAAEVRYHNQQQDRALEEIKTLFAEIKSLGNCPKAAEIEPALNILQGGAIDPEGPIAQVHWPYRSWRILQKLKIQTLKQAVDYFAVFANCAENDEMTLWEWAVITATLRREKLLSSENKTTAQLNDKLDDMFGFNDGNRGRMRIKVSNALLRANILTVRDLLCHFAGGMKNGWRSLSRVRGFGEVSQKFLIQAIDGWEIVIPPEYCEPTKQTAAEVLDFSRPDLESFKWYQIKTVDDLSAAYLNTNRFSGMRYNNPKLHETVVRRLTDYGFMT